MTTFAIEIMDLGFVLTLGACWAAITLVALAAAAIRRAVAGSGRAAHRITPGNLDA